MSPRHIDVPRVDATLLRDEACPVREVLDRVSGKWSISILLAALCSPVRFTDLERRIEGISRRMLTLTLRQLERDGLLTRTIYPTVPARVEYVATPIARELHGTLTELADWAARNARHISAARAAFDEGHAPSSPPDKCAPLQART